MDNPWKSRASAEVAACFATRLRGYFKYGYSPLRGSHEMFAALPE
jgi:hypothetical protein